MEIVLTEGCQQYNLEIDGVGFASLSEEKNEYVWMRVLDYLKDTYSSDMLNEALQELLWNMGDCEYLGQCEQCFDSIFKYKIEI